MLAMKLSEEKFNQLLPLLYESYPKTDGRNQSKINDIVQLYQSTSFCDNTIIGLIDVSKRSFVYLSDNIVRLGHSQKDLVERGILNPFRIIYESHHSLPFQYLKLQNTFLSKLMDKHTDTKNYFCGIKVINNEGKVCRLFVRTKMLLADENNNAALFVCFIEDITHLIKNDAYWLRIENGNKSIAYVHQKGKKEFKDVISKKEKETLLLMAQHKSNIEIANELFVSTSTIESHRKNMIKRLGASSSGALIHLCRMANII